MTDYRNVSPFKGNSGTMYTGRTMGYALEILRNEMKHYFMCEVDNFVGKRLVNPQQVRQRKHVFSLL